MNNVQIIEQKKSLVKAIGWFLMLIPLGIAYVFTSIFTQIALLLGL